MAQRELCETKQNRVLDAVRKNPSLRQFEMAQIIGCKNSTIKDWFRDNTLGWNEKYKQALRDAFNSLEGPAIQCMTELIKDKNFQAAKYILDNKDYGAPTKVSAELNGEVVINIGIDDDSQS